MLAAIGGVALVIFGLHGPARSSPAWACSSPEILRLHDSDRLMRSPIDADPDGRHTGTVKPLRLAGLAVIRGTILELMGSLWSEWAQGYACDVNVPVTLNP